MKTSADLQRLGSGKARLAFLRWVAGSSLAAMDDELQTICDDTMLDAVIAHKIVGRALEKLLTSGSDLSGRAICGKIERVFIEQQLRHKSQTNALRILIDKLNLSLNPAIAIKGSSLFQLTQDCFRIKYSNDIDLLVADPGSARSDLMLAGFADEWMAAGHEEINILFRNVYFDIHKYFPIYRIANPDMASKNSQSSAPHHHYGNLEILRLNYEILSAHAGRRSFAWNTNLVYPSATHAALICAMHLFTDFIRVYSSVMRFRPLVRLYELLDLIELTCLPTFSETEFLSLVKLFKIQVELSIVGKLAYTILGDKTILAMLGSTPEPAWKHNYEGPIFLAFGFQYELTLSAEQIVGEPFGLEQAIKMIGPNQLQLSDRGATLDLNAPGILAHVHGGPLDWSGQLERIKDSIKLTLIYSLHGLSHPYISFTLGTDYYRYFPASAKQNENMLITSGKKPLSITSNAEAGLYTSTIYVDLPESGNEEIYCSIVLGNVHLSSMTDGVFIPFKFAVNSPSQ